MTPSDKPLLRAIAGAPVRYHPFWLMRQAGRYLPEYRAIRSKAKNFVELCLTPDLATEITVQPIRRYGMDAAILFSDILMVPYALGQPLAFQEGEGPKLEPIRDERGLTRLASVIDLDRLSAVYETISLVKAQLGPETTLIGFVGAPWTLATYAAEGGSSRAFDHVRGWAATDPAGFRVLIDRLTEAVIAHVGAQIEAGVEVIQIFDSWASAAGPDGFDPWVLEPTQRIIQAVRARWPGVPIIGFPKSIGPLYARYAVESGADMVSIDTDVPLGFASEVMQRSVAVQGNLDPELLVAGGPALEARIREIIRVLGQGRFVFNLGHGVLQTTPPDHVAQLAEIIRSIPAPTA